MRTIAIWLVAIATSLAIGYIAFAQEIITIQRPIHSRSLIGVVVDPSGAPVEGVLVEDCDQSFMHVFVSVRTNKEGRFVFPKAKRGSTHYLRFFKNGFDPMRVKVQMRHLAPAEVRIHLVVAT
jgi:hypothetical protein